MDLRAWGFSGWRYVLGPAELPELAAGALAAMKLEELRREAGAGPQLELRAGAPRTVSDLLDELWRSRSVYDSAAGRDYVKNTIRHVRADLGALALGALAPPDGDQRLVAYVGELVGRGLGARTVRNRVGLVGQLLRLAATRRWIVGVPAMPKLPRVPPPRYEYQDEATIRAVRDSVLSRWESHGAELHGEAWPVYIARRRCGISLLFYLGLHPMDVFGDGTDGPGFRGEHIALDLGSFVRVNTKSAAHVPVEQFDEVPEPLIDDLRALLQLLGREAFYPRELIAGGPWPHCDRHLAAAQARLKIPGARLNTRVLRRSWVRMMRLLGYSLEECGARAGHSDTRMIHEVYSRVPAPLGRVRRSRWTRRPLPAAPTRHAGARLVAFVRPDAGTGSADED